MNEQLRHWVENVTDDKIQSAQQMAGSTSSTLYRLQTNRRELVLRVFDNAEWLAEEPDLARHEAAVLERTQTLALPAPNVVAYDETGASCGGLPVILMTFLPGEINLQPANIDDWLRQLAETLVTIHNLPVDDFGWSYFPWGEIKGQSVPEWTTTPENWRRAIEIAEGPEPSYREVFLHRDYHPMNVLWQGQTLCGVVDWVNACRGPAGVDLAHCRTNLVAMYGLDAADHFLSYYEQVIGPSFTYDPYWEIIGLVSELAYPVEVYLPWAGFGLTGITVKSVQAGLDAYIASVLARC